MAVLCERLDRQPDGTVDVVGVVDGVSLSGTPIRAAPPSTPPPRSCDFWPGVDPRRRGPRPSHVSLRAHFPDGELGATLTRPIELTDQAPGATIGFPFELEARDTGTYWFDVAYDDSLLTRIPLVVERG